MHPRHRVLVIVLLVLAAAYLGIDDPLVDRPHTEDRTVTAVIDGDTVRLADGQRLRLVGINTPETGQPHAAAATQRLTQLIANETATIEYAERPQDQYGRLLGYLHVNGTLVNRVLVREGLATVYVVGNPGRHHETLLAAEQTAQQERTGLWEQSPTADCVTVTAFNPDPPGDDTTRLHAENLTLRNTCDTAITLRDWSVKDAGTNRYDFTGLTLEQGGAVTLRSGTGTDTQQVLHWGSEQAVWNNDGDAVFVRDAAGRLVAYRAYGHYCDRETCGLPAS